MLTRAVNSIQRQGFSRTTAPPVPSAVAQLQSVDFIPEFSDLVKSVQSLGFDASVAERIVLLKGTYFVKRLLAEVNPPAPVVAYRGINAAIQDYNPKAILSGGHVWLTRDVSDAQGFTDMLVREGRGGYGLLLKLQIPNKMYGTQQVRQLLSRSDIPDDRAFIQQVGLQRNGRLEWVDFDVAVAQGIIPRIVEDDVSVTVSP